MPKKIVVARAPAHLELRICKVIPRRDHLVIIIESDSQVGKRPNIKIFDHRPISLAAATRFFRAKGKRNVRIAHHEMINTIKSPAVVCVVRTICPGHRSYHYINLFPLNGNAPSALLKQISLIASQQAGFQTLCNNALWNKRFKHDHGSNGSHEMMFLFLTDAAHDVSLLVHGEENEGPGGENCLILGKECTLKAQSQAI